MVVAQRSCACHMINWLLDPNLLRAELFFCYHSLSIHISKLFVLKHVNQGDATLLILHIKRFAQIVVNEAKREFFSFNLTS